MKKLIMWTVVVFVAFLVGKTIQSEKKQMNDILLMNVEALANDEGVVGDYGCAGNATWIKDRALQSATCWNGGSHKVCKKMNGVCCDPSMMTDCSPLID